MAVRHVEEYYKQVCSQRQQVIEDLHDVEKEAMEGMLSPDRLEEIKESLQPILNNYQTISWIMYLLHKPNREKKQSKYMQRNKKFISSLDSKYSTNEILKENSNIIKETFEK